MKQNAKDENGGLTAAPFSTNAFWKRLGGYAKHTYGEDQRKRSQLAEDVEGCIDGVGVQLTISMIIFYKISFLNDF